MCSTGFPGGSDGKESACNVGDLGSIPGLGRFPWRRAWLPTPFFGFFRGSVGKQSTCKARELGLIPRLGRFPWRRAWQPTPVFLPGESPWTEEPGGLQSMGLQRVGHLAERLSTAHTGIHGEFENFGYF